jgi:uncharacterized membrane protein
MSLSRLRHDLRDSLLVIPAMFAIGALLLAAASAVLDDVFNDTAGADALFRGDHETARAILTSIAGASITLTALVFSITMLVLQLTSDRYSPRLLRTFLRDRNSQLTLGVFVGTFTYTLAVLRTVAADQESSPGVAVSIAVLLALVTVFVFVQYINHIAQQIRVTSITSAIADETAAAIERLFPEQPEQPLPWQPVDGPYGVAIASPRRGVVVNVDTGSLAEAAARADAQIELTVPIGTFVAEGATVLRVRTFDADADDSLVRHVTIAKERSISSDPAFGFRQLVDIAERSLSPSTNDPTTAVQAIDAIHDLLRRVLARATPSGRHTDDAGHLRVMVPERSFDDYLDLCVDEVLLYGRGSLQVTARLAAMLRDLLASAPDDRRGAIESKLRRVQAAAEDLHRALERPSSGVA